MLSLAYLNAEGVQLSHLKGSCEQPVSQVSAWPGRAATFPCKVPQNFPVTVVSPGASVQPTPPASDTVQDRSGLLLLGKERSHGEPQP